MKFSLDYGENFEKSLLFWLGKFLKFKLNSLSNKELKDPKALNEVNRLLATPNLSLKNLDTLAKKARNAGLTGINTYFNPLIKISSQLIEYSLHSISQIDEELLSEVLACSTGGLSDASKKNYRIAVINFFKFIDRQNEHKGAAHNFAIELKNWAGVSGNKGVKLPEFLSEDEVVKFIQAIDAMPFKSGNARNKCIIKLITFTGIRVGEAINLKRKDISEEGELFVIRIRGKGNKYRIVMIKKALISVYLEQMDTNYQSSGHLFVNSRGMPLTQAFVSRSVEQILLSAGIRKEKNGAHMLRHTFATLLYKKHKDLILVQEALGHASLNTSRIYTHFDSDRLKMAAEVAQNLADDALK